MDDLDPTETQEWLDSLDSIGRKHGQRKGHAWRLIHGAPHTLIGPMERSGDGDESE